MQLAFASKELRAVCEVEAEARELLGATVAETLKHRLADIRAADSVKDLVAGSPHQLTGAERQHFAVDLTDGYQLILAANHLRKPTTGAGELDWNQVSRIILLRIGGGR